MDLFSRIVALCMAISVTSASYVRAASAVSTSTCPCQDPAHCKLVEAVPRQEVLGFSTHPGKWKHYDWSKLTTVAVFREWDSDALEMMCYAHSRNVRVVLVGFFDVANLTHSDIVDAWVKNMLTQAVQYHADGINIDVEQPIPQGHKKEAELLVQLVKQTRDTFHARFPYSQVTFDVAWSPDCVDRRCYDAKGIADACDFLVVMSYDEQGQIYKPAPCIAGANSGPQQTTAGLVGYLKLGISANKLVLGQPWYGYDYECIEPKNATAGGSALDVPPASGVCHIRAVPYQGAYCSDAAGRQREFWWVTRMLRGNASNPGRHWDVASLSPYFDFVDQATGQRHQVWYDDPISLAIKYELVQKMRLRGLAFWGTDFLDYTGTEEARAEAVVMWDTVNVRLSPPGGE
ncbi:di-N-acetylchitobiase-like [Sycon ciliatum]|uniref:di-N-acetylchitobiase-like n=1 Tax=Sycon ciliatum TaxID=27933 RepID=UPI0020A982EA|eukprot:scpid47127/ scgid29717/ Di-N-acetylchitobiase